MILLEADMSEEGYVTSGCYCADWRVVYARQQKPEERETVWKTVRPVMLEIVSN